MFSRCLFFLTIFIVHLSSPHAEETVCRSTNKCDCYRNANSGRYEYQCPPSSFGSKTIIHVYPNVKKLTIDCNNTDVLNDDYLPRGNFGVVTKLHMQECPIPQNGFKGVMDRFNITHLEFLSFKGQPNSQSFDANHFEGLTELKVLELKRNNIVTFDSAIFNKMPLLTEVMLDDNTIEMKSDLFFNLPDLRSLSLHHNGIETIPENTFTGSVNLERLDLWKNELEALENGMFTNLVNLRTLELSINKITRIADEALNNLTNLTQINLRRNNLKNISRRIFENCNILELIRLDENPNMNLTDDVFSNFTYLKKINLAHNQMGSISESLFSGSVSLKQIYLNNNNLKKLPKGVFKDLRNLEMLNLNNNGLKNLNGEIFSSLENLEILQLKYNELEYIDEFLLRSLINLKEIDLSFNRISRMHQQSLSRNKNLVKFFMSHNEFDFEKSRMLDSNMPFSSYSCLNLKKVDLSFNNISRYPYNLNSIIGMESINLENNLIKEIKIERLVYLSYNRDIMKINLDHNMISSVDFNGLTNPERSIDRVAISISNNPIICDCHAFDLARYVQEKDNIFYDHLILEYVQLNCSNMEKVSLEVVDLGQLTCSLGTNFTKPEVCDSIYRPFDRTVLVECSRRELQEAPEIKLDQIREIFDFVDYNQTEVHLEHNRLRRCPNDFDGYENTTELYLAGNQIENITSLPKSLKTLDLRDNALKDMDGISLRILNESSATEIHLGGNLWYCDCSMRNFSIYLRENSLKIVDALDVLCSNFNSSRLINLNENDLCESKPNTWITLLILLITISILIACLTSCLYYKYEKPILIWLYSRGLCLWLAKEEDIDKDMIFDAFVSFSHADEEFVTEKIISVLESGDNPYKLCVHVRDWIGGERIQTQIFNSVRDSRRTIVVLSPSFLKSDWGMLEFRTAHAKAMQEGRSRVIIIIYGEIDMESLDDQLQDYMKTNTYIKWGDPWFWNKLRFALPKNKKIRNDLSKRHANMMQFIDDKFSLVGYKQPISAPNTTPPILMNPCMDFEERKLTGVA